MRPLQVDWRIPACHVRGVGIGRLGAVSLLACAVVHAQFGFPHTLTVAHMDPFVTTSSRFPCAKRTTLWIVPSQGYTDEFVLTPEDLNMPYEEVQFFTEARVEWANGKHPSSCQVPC